MELKDTVGYMLSDDYKERFKAEYYQTEIRYNKLVAMLDKWNKRELGFTPTCPHLYYSRQVKAMKTYLDILKARANIEEVGLE